MTNVPDKGKTGMVVVASAPTLCEAEVTRAVLQAAGIDAFIIGEAAAQWLPHMSVALNPRGIEVAVRAEDADAAEEALKPQPEAFQGPHAKEPVEDADYANSPDYYAERAYRSTWLTFICLPFVFVTPYLFIRAVNAASGMPPRDRRKFRARMTVVFVVGIILPWILVGWLVYSFLPLGLSRVPVDIYIPPPQGPQP